VAEEVARLHLLALLSPDLQPLGDIVRSVPDLPRNGIDFRHILGIAEQPGGLNLCATLLQSHFNGDWNILAAVVCCEAGGFLFASALASRTKVPMALIRKAGRLPPPTVSVMRSASRISSSDESHKERTEMGRHAIPRGTSVVVVDDVLATGKTLCAVLELLMTEAGVPAENISVIVVAEFPVHRGRELLYWKGFGGVVIQSLLIFGGV
jgi:adenine phosphoribosyltransferase